MINPVAAPRASDAFASEQPAPAAPPKVEAGNPAAPQAEPEPDVRLTIDAAPDGCHFVYTLKDRTTGRILAQLPRQAAADLGQRSDYQAGDLIRAKA